ncbi:MAG: DUF11 domain-containing protein, partial [Bacteroidales bacterium]|nr:DUF11 domain-containing protein [Bacteroidales bacterium]
MKNKNYTNNMEANKIVFTSLSPRVTFRKIWLVLLLLLILPVSMIAQVTNTKTVDKATAAPNDMLNYGVTVGYQGNEQLINVRVIDPIPTGTSYVTSSANAGGTYGSYTPLAGENGLDTEGGPLGTVTLETSLTPTVNFIITGNSITLTFNVKQNSGSTVNNVSPADFTVEGGSYTIISGPTPTSQNVPTGATGVNFSWVIQLDQPGEYVFSASAANDTETYIWPSATSTSVFSALHGGTNVVAWSLGSNTAAIPNEIIISGAPAGVYGFRGNTTQTFSRYGLTSAGWTARQDYGFNIAKGGALTTDGDSIIYGLQGGGQQRFRKYNTITNQWTALTNTGANVNEGGALVFLSIGGADSVYAFMGNGKGFRRYNVTANTWTARADAPENVKWGGALTTDGTYIYAFRGDGKKNFWKYDPATNTWSSLALMLENVKAGGSLTYLNGHIYAFQGDDKIGFYRYNIIANSWTKMANTPAKVKEGGALTNDGTTIYGLQGDNFNGFWRYNPATDTWTTLSNYYNNLTVKDGGALVYVPQAEVNGLLNTIHSSSSLVISGSNIVITMELIASSPVSDVTPGTVSVSGNNGASATYVSGPTIISTDDDIVDANDKVIYQWVYTANSGTNPGSLTFTAGATGNGGTTDFGSATTNSTLVTPLLTFQSSVDETAPLVIKNSAILTETSGSIFNSTSNVTETSTACNLNVEITGYTNVSCFDGNDGEIDLTVNDAVGTYTVSWVGPDSYQSSVEDISGLEAGTYTVTVTDSKDCVDQTSVTLTQPTALVSSLISKTDIDCFGENTGTVNFSGYGGTSTYTYSIDDIEYFPSGTFTGLAAGTYTAYVKDANSCGPATFSFTITQPSAPLAVDVNVSQPTCFVDGSITLDVSGGTSPYTYDWLDLPGSNNPKNRSGLLQGDYDVTVTDAKGCSVATGTFT